ncbi:MBL fold metallo-hydrolase [Paenibacillus taiwanensis]|uniref:MBL fold metallo-hydrolase n=1 Tax=Paenibacillus taiwanensis TaxID=401638 RepID=UPI000403F85C|nr:MBL fold metallo-hydrolase [Paenibacillus taiwanensis]
MKVSILGYWGGYPLAGGATSGYLVTTEEGHILLDCGSGVMSRLSHHATVEQLSGVILSHVHYDHMADIGVLQYAALGAIRNNRMQHKLQLFAPEQPADIFGTLFGPHTDVTQIDSTLKLRLAGADIEFAPVEHTITCFAVKITYKGKVLVYSGDTAYCESLVKLAKDADMLLCEATVCEGSTHTTGQGHMNAAEAATIAEKAGVKKLVLVHLPCDGNLLHMRQTASSVYRGPVFLPDAISSYTI